MQSTTRQFGRLRFPVALLALAFALIALPLHATLTGPDSHTSLDTEHAPATEVAATIVKAGSMVPGPIGLAFQAFGPFILAGLALWQTHTHHKLKTLEKRQPQGRHKDTP